MTDKQLERGTQLKRRIQELKFIIMWATKYEDSDKTIIKHKRKELTALKKEFAKL